MLRFVLFLVAVSVSLPLTAQPTREELLSEPRLLEEDLRPSYTSVQASALESLRKVRAVVLDHYGNTLHAIEFSIPAGHNALHTIATFSVPELRDAEGNSIEPDGLNMKLDADAGTLALVYLTEYEDMPRVSSVKGSMIVRYPLAVTPHSVKANDAEVSSRYGIQIDGPFVLFAEDKTPVERWLSDYHTLRAYDASGARLEHMGFWSGDAGPYLPVRGEVARFDFDVPGELAAVALDYELDPSNPDAATVTYSRLPSIPISVLGESIHWSYDQMLGYLEGYTGTMDERLMSVIAAGDEKSVRFLLALGADPRGNEAEGFTPFVSAAMLLHDEIAYLLLDAGADVATADANGVTPLFGIVSVCPSAALVNRMIARGADVNAKGPGGATALAIAEAVQCRDVVAALKSAGAK